MDAIAQQTSTPQRTLHLSKADKIWLWTHLDGCRFRYDRETRSWIPDNPFSDTVHHVRYSVRGHDIETSCDCVAGRHGAICWAAECARIAGVPGIQAPRRCDISPGFEARIQAAGVLQREA